jgi:hypothetical protein
VSDNTYWGQLEIDRARGVIYFHCVDPQDVERLGAVTILRICQLPVPIPVDRTIDITHMHGADYGAGIEG